MKTRSDESGLLKKRSPGPIPTAQIGAIAFIHPCLRATHRQDFGASLNPHTHFRICVIDGVFAGARDDSPIAFFAAEPMDAPTVAAVQSSIHRRACSSRVRLFVRRGLLEADDAKELAARRHDGGLSLDASVRFQGHDRAGLERLLRYCARPTIAQERIERIFDERIVYHPPKPTPDRQTRLTLTPLEFISRLAVLIPAPRRHRHRYHGVLAPTARLLPAVTARARDAGATGEVGASGGVLSQRKTLSSECFSALERPSGRAAIWSIASMPCLFNL